MGHSTFRLEAGHPVRVFRESLNELVLAPDSIHVLARCGTQVTLWREAEQVAQWDAEVNEVGPSASGLVATYIKAAGGERRFDLRVRDLRGETVAALDTDYTGDIGELAWSSGMAYPA